MPASVLSALVFAIVVPTQPGDPQPPPSQEAEPPVFHTSPFCWSEPRIHSEPRVAAREVRIERRPRAREVLALVSPNGAYAAAVGERPLLAAGAVWNAEVEVEIERPYRLHLVFPRTNAIADVRWVNEQLLYLRVWEGRIAGTDYVLDVERERFVHTAPFRYGAIAFQQFRQCAEPEWSDRPMCRCENERGDER